MRASFLNQQRGFTLLEMAIVLVIAGLMVGMATQSQQSAVAPSACYQETQRQLLVIRDAMNAFVAKNQRFPIPAGRSLSVKDPKFGRETTLPADLANIDRLSGTNSLLFGALPFQALGLGESFAADCWGNKFTYVITEKMTTSASSGGYTDPATVGGITLRTGAGFAVADASASPSTGMAFVVISHGENGAAVGGAPKNYSQADHKWCTAAAAVGGAALDTQNCEIGNNIIVTESLNNGKSAGANFYDDLILPGGKTAANNTAEGGPLYCWGRGNLGNGRTDSKIPVRVSLPTGVTGFKDVAQGGNASCALANTGDLYCWGNDGPWGGGGGTRTTPTLMTRGSVDIDKIYAGQDSYCALDKNGNAYCLSGGSLPAGAWVMPSGVKFTSLAVNSAYQCGVGNDGWAYCKGWNAGGAVGDGTTTNRTNAVPIARGDIPVGVTITKIAASGGAFCALGSDGNGYCWGENYGNFGNGGGSSSTVPKLTTKPGGVTSFVNVSGSDKATCWVGNDTNTYCTGDGTAGQTGGAGYPTIPTLINATPGGIKFTGLYADPGRTTQCGLGTDKKAYCWGSGYLGDTGGGDSASSVAVYGDYTFSKISMEENVICGLSDKTTTEMTSGRLFCWGRTQGYACGMSGASPQSIVEIPLPVGRKVTAFDGGALYGACAVLDNGNAYCWGAGWGMQGDGTKLWGSQPVRPVTMPTGVKFTKIKTAAYHVCALGDNQKVYCWGGERGIINGPMDTNLNANGEIGDGTTGTMRLLPTEIDTSGIPVSTFTDIALSNWTGTSCALGTDEKPYCWGSNTYGGTGAAPTYTTNQAKPVPVNVPSGHYTQLTGHAYGNTFCVRRTEDGREYCWGLNGDFDANLWGTINGGGNFGTPTSVDYRWTEAGFQSPLASFTNYKVHAHLNCGYDGTSSVACTNNAYYVDASSAGERTQMLNLLAKGKWITGYGWVAALDQNGIMYTWRGRSYPYDNFAGLTNGPALWDSAGITGYGITGFKEIGGGGYQIFAIAK